MKRLNSNVIKLNTQLCLILFLMMLLMGCAQKAHVPAGFVNVKEMIPTVQVDIRYYSANNFVGTRIDGYEAPNAILTSEAARALKDVSEDVNKQGYVLKIFDAYRPQKAVNHFARWADNINDTRMKSRFYPHVDKKDLFSLGYIAKKSGHTRGSTVDLTLVDKKTGKELDMGCSFDYLDPVSAYGTPLISPQQSSNRELLKNAMLRHGFKAYANEWWHYTLINEPYPDKYFNFDVE